MSQTARMERLLASSIAEQARDWRVPAEPSDPLTEAMAELNLAPGTETDAGMARAFRLILARKGLAVVEARHG